MCYTIFVIIKKSDLSPAELVCGRQYVFSAHLSDLFRSNTNIKRKSVLLTQKKSNLPSIPRGIYHLSGEYSHTCSRIILVLSKLFENFSRRRPQHAWKQPVTWNPRASSHIFIYFGLRTPSFFLHKF